MLTVAVHDHHPLHRDLRTLAADLVFDLPVIGAAARKAGHTMACAADAHRLLSAGELTAVFPDRFQDARKTVQASIATMKAAYAKKYGR